MQLPTVYYVYVYRESDGSVVYVGMGKGGRAWQCQRTNGDTQERNDWKQEQMRVGRLPCDWVEIVCRGLSKSEALELEALLIEEIRPPLNVLHNPDAKGSKWDEFDPLVLALRQMGYSYQNISFLFGWENNPMWSYRLCQTV